MKDDSGDLFRRGIWFAAGCAVLGPVLILRTIGDATFSPGTTWFLLVLGVLITPGAIETGRQNIDLPLSATSAVASILGLLIFVVGYVMAGGMGDFLNLGPVFTFLGFGTGTVCNLVTLWDVLTDLKEQWEQRKHGDEPVDVDLKAPVKFCPKCGLQIPRYATACQFCKSILS